MIQSGKGPSSASRDKQPVGAAPAVSGELHTPAELAASGIRKLRVVTERQLEELARAAVDRVLKGRLDGLGISDPAVRALQARCQEEFRGAALAGPPAMPPPLPHATSARQESPAAAAIAPEGEARLANQVSNLLSENWRSELKAVESSQREHLLLLEERIAKLVRALESTDQVLSQLKISASGKAAAETEPAFETAGNGMPRALSPLYEQKTRLLDAIFQANVELRRLKDDRSGA